MLLHLFDLGQKPSPDAQPYWREPAKQDLEVSLPHGTADEQGFARSLDLFEIRQQIERWWPIRLWVERHFAPLRRGLNDP